MTHTDGLTERAPRIASTEYFLRYGRTHGRIEVCREAENCWWVWDWRPGGTVAEFDTFAAAMEHADQLTKEQNR